jgi:3-oxoacyl-[acyl-carrier protein] reductase
MDLRLTGLSVFVSGGSRGIGLAIAQSFANEGADVTISARHQRDLLHAQAEVGQGCAIYQMDAVNPEECAEAIRFMEKSKGALNILVTCVGSGQSVPPGQETANEWQRVINLNLFSATNLITAATPLLSRSMPASIVCISSICGREALGAPVAYSAAKSALDAAVNGLSRPLAMQNIRINSVSPGNIFFQGGTWDKKQKDNPDLVQKMLISDVPMQRFGTPESVADAVIFLGSPRADFITGANLVVDGGQTRS